MDYLLKYIGQMGQTFYTRYKENIQTKWHSNDNLVYSNHILNAGHAYGSVTKAMKVIKQIK
jgi:hypothetical protein